MPSDRRNRQHSAKKSSGKPYNTPLSNNGTNQIDGQPTIQLQIGFSNGFFWYHVPLQLSHLFSDEANFVSVFPNKNQTFAAFKQHIQNQLSNTKPRLPKSHFTILTINKPQHQKHLTDDQFFQSFLQQTELKKIQLIGQNTVYWDPPTHHVSPTQHQLPIEAFLLSQMVNEADDEQRLPDFLQQMVAEQLCNLIS